LTQLDKLDESSSSAVTAGHRTLLRVDDEW